MGEEKRTNILSRGMAMLGRAAIAIALVTLKYWAFAPALVEDVLRQFR